MFGRQPLVVITASVKRTSVLQECSQEATELTVKQTLAEMAYMQQRTAVRCFLDHLKHEIRFENTKALLA